MSELADSATSKWMLPAAGDPCKLGGGVGFGRGVLADTPDELEPRRLPLDDSPPSDADNEASKSDAHLAKLPVSRPRRAGAALRRVGFVLSPLADAASAERELDDVNRGDESGDPLDAMV